jgi:hypothetical protein
MYSYTLAKLYETVECRVELHSIYFLSNSSVYVIRLTRNVN